MCIRDSVGTGQTIRYSGSPIALSFGERDSSHQVLELTFDNGRLTDITSLPIPRFRSLRQVAGTLDDVRERLTTLEPTDGLPTLVEVLVEEDHESLATRMQFEQLRADFAQAPFRLAKTRLTFRNKKQGLDALYAIDTQLQDLSYLDVFSRRLDAANVADDLRAVLTETYKELYRSIVPLSLIHI